MAKKSSSKPRGARRGHAVYRPGSDPVAQDTFARGRPDPLYNFHDQLTPDTARGAVDAATQMRYGGAEAQLADQMRGVGQRFQNVTNWFDQYKADLEKAKTAQAAYYQGAQDANAQLVQQAAAQAPVQGQQTVQQQTDSKNAASVRQGLAEAFGQLLAANRGTEQAYLGERQGVGSAAQLSERLKTDQMMRDLERQGGDLAREKGAFRTQYAGELRDKERSYADQLHRQRLERQAFGLDVAKAGAEADAKANEVNQYGFTASQWAAMTPQQRRAAIRGLRDKPAPKDHYGIPEDEWNKMSLAQRRKAKGLWDSAGGGGGTAETKRTRDVRQKSREALGRLDDVRGDYERLKRTPWRDKILDPLTGMEKDGPPRAATREEIERELRALKYRPSEIRLAMKKTWDASDIRLAHSLGIRVPRDRIARPRKPSRPERYSKGGGPD